MYGYIYMTENLVNGKRYIGQHISPKFDNWYRGSGKLLLRAIEKYGKENFRTHIIQECDNLDELNQAEVDWIEKYNAVESNEFYNLALGGRNCKLTDEIKAKISKVIKEQIANGERRTTKGTHLSEETKAKIGKWSNEHKYMFSKKVYCLENDTVYDSCAEAQRQLNVSAVSDICLGKRLSSKGYHFVFLEDKDKEHNFRNSRWRMVENIDAGEIFDSVKHAADSVDGNPSAITSACRGRISQHRGYHWRYVMEEKDDK